MQRWYESAHGSGNLDLVRYVPFMLAWVHGGPHGIEVAATSSADYFAGWRDEGGGLAWPEGWDRDPTTFRSGISFDDENSISPADLRRLEDWHRENQGEVPGYVP